MLAARWNAGHQWVDGIDMDVDNSRLRKARGGLPALGASRNLARRVVGVHHWQSADLAPTAIGIPNQLSPPFVVLDHETVQPVDLFAQTSEVMDCCSLGVVDGPGVAPRYNSCVEFRTAECMTKWP